MHFFHMNFLNPNKLINATMFLFGNASSKQSCMGIDRLATDMIMMTLLYLLDTPYQGLSGVPGFPVGACLIMKTDTQHAFVVLS